MLSGHDHDYERFTPLDVRGRPSPDGMTSFVVGTGGKDLHDLGSRKRGSRYFRDDRHGVLALDLRRGSFGYSFHGIDGRVLDEGSRPACEPRVTGCDAFRWTNGSHARGLSR